MTKPRHILVVCAGNICRSPMAKELLTRGLNEAGLQTIQVKSAGLEALAGRPADKIAQHLMLERGFDVSAHRARQLNREILHWADLVLVMDRAQKLALESWEPSARGKVYRLGEWNDFDVPDPYRQSKYVFDVSLDLITRGVSDWITKLRE